MAGLLRAAAALCAITLVQGDVDKLRGVSPTGTSICSIIVVIDKFCLDTVHVRDIIKVSVVRNCRCLQIFGKYIRMRQWIEIADLVG
jgi:hypothetical protein